MQLNRYRKKENMDIKYQNMRFSIGEGPNYQNFEKYIEDLIKLNANVRVREPTYSREKLEPDNIKFIDAKFEIGQSPTPELREKLLNLLKEQFRQNPNTCVSIHSVSGLSRTPSMVAMALMELGISYEEVLDLIRSKRADALSLQELKFRSVKKSRRKIQKNLCTIIIL
ncbi:tyrosine phosphatase type IVA 1 [Brachionus plicatilis]|uniref:Tyrosine phosphatase type IVA 1 n=1 Tax=Brachionus plicatilis TaxID=10195 RepID=A0A3M7RFE4_BRAPC|nr:tyrosine phosphatase type IVA 1 [Brachionus plicatilis]